MTESSSRPLSGGQMIRLGVKKRLNVNASRKEDTEASMKMSTVDEEAVIPVKKVRSNLNINTLRRTTTLELTNSLADSALVAAIENPR
jgi:hypothetical protein